MSETLEQRIAGQLAAPVDEAASAFARHLAGSGEAQAVLFYGSNLRTGSLEGVLDFYLLLPGAQKEKIWPRVSYHERAGEAAIVLRAKVASMSLERFMEAASGERLDTTMTRMVTHERGRLQKLSDRLDALDRLRKTLGYKATLSRGYAVVRDGDAVVTTQAAAKKAKALEIEFADGRVTVSEAGNAGKKTSPKRKPDPDTPDQGSLF